MQQNHVFPTPDLNAQIASGLLDLLKRVMETTVQGAATLPPTARVATETRIDAAARVEIEQMIKTAVPVSATPAPAMSKRDDPFDDPDFVAIWNESTDGVPFWEESEEVLLSQFAFTLDWLTRLFEVYVRYCIREGKDPRTAFKPLVNLAGGFSNAAEDIASQIRAGVILAPAESADAPGARAKRLPAGDVPISEFSKRYLDLRCQGYALERRHETPDAKSGASFASNSRRNIEATVRLFIDLFGDVAVGDIKERHAKEFITLIQRIPKNHGKSAKDRRSIREVIADADNEEARQIEAIRARFRKEGRTPGEIEDAEHEARITRLRTDTCLRHMRDFSKMLDFACLDGLIAENEFKQYVWTGREVSRRKNNEISPQRTWWGDKINVLLASKIFRGPFKPKDEELFWAPLIAIFTGMRMEEILQLRTDDFGIDDGIPYVLVDISDEGQGTKAPSSKRSIPLHKYLLDIGLLHLVEERRNAGLKRLFTHIRRGKNKNTYAENFSKKFAYYLRANGLKEPGLDFHGLRTDFQTRLTRARVPEHARKAMMGHAQSDVTHGHYYRDGDTIQMVRDDINKIEIDVSGVFRPYGIS